MMRILTHWKRINMVIARIMRLVDEADKPRCDEYC